MRYSLPRTFKEFKADLAPTSKDDLANHEETLYGMAEALDVLTTVKCAVAR